MLFAVLMAIQAARASIRCGYIFEGENLRFVAAAIHVGFARAMACFASVPLRPSFGVQRGSVVWRSFVIFIEILFRHVLMAGLTGFRADVQGGIGRPHIFLRVLLLCLRFTGLVRGFAGAIV